MRKKADWECVKNAEKNKKNLLMNPTILKPDGGGGTGKNLDKK